ncbi:MAG: alkyl/aryl-sulfatase, partial [Gammaproteobacteria bacterium]|nr:alkyl/aryl-sulfatase [Gammaproteobacteria bacterium]
MKNIKLNFVLLLSCISFPIFAQQLTGADPTQAGANQTEAVEITDVIFQANGFGNSFMVTTPAGNVIIDTSLVTNAARHKELLQAKNDGPVKYIIITHAHGDHTGGINLWREEGTEVIAQEEHVEFVNYQYRLRGLFGQRNAAQFPGLAAGIRAREIPDGVDNYGATIQATILFDQEYRFELGGIEFVVMHTPGETYDHLSVWIPEYKAAFVGDNYYSSFPNMYTLRGTKPRWALDYVNSLNRILALEPEILIPSHGQAVHGFNNIETSVSRYRDAILYVHDETVKGMNQGKDVYTLMDEIKLPSDLDIGEGYGTIAWTVRGIYENYIGWFDGNPSSMFSTPPSDVYPDLVALAGGAESVAELAQRYFSQSEFERALHAADIALKADPQNESALNVRLEALQSLADQSENSNEKGWLQFGIRQT